MKPIVVVNKSGDELRERLRALIWSILESQSRPVFVGVSGGSMVAVLADVLPCFSPEYDRLRVLLVDERVVPLSSPDSLLGEYRRLMGDSCPVKDFTRTEDLSETAWAASYELYLRELEDLPLSGGFARFDLVLLGLGEDGHTASLFPGREHSTQSWVIGVTESPKPPPLRVSLSLPLLCNASRVVFIATGAGKAPILKRIMDGDESLPATLVRPSSGSLEFFIDEYYVMVSSAANDVDVDEAAAGLGSLRLGGTSPVPTPSTPVTSPSEEKKRAASSTPSFRPTRMKYRWTTLPYRVPPNRPRSKSVPILGNRRQSEAYFKKLSSIRLKGDVDGLRMCILESPRCGGEPLNCSMQATRPPDDLEELAEYFNAFVHVQLKMSDLAQSMYA